MGSSKKCLKKRGHSEHVKEELDVFEIMLHIYIFCIFPLSNLDWQRFAHEIHVGGFLLQF